MDSCIHAGLKWLLSSGVQDETGNVSASYRADSRRFSESSLEASALFISALLDLSVEGEQIEAAKRAGASLMENSFDLTCDLFATEGPEGKKAKLGDQGASIGALTALYLATNEFSYIDCAQRCGRAIQTRMSRVDGSLFTGYDLSRQAPIENGEAGSSQAGVGQLKIAKALLALEEACGKHEFESTTGLMLKWTLARQESALPKRDDPDRVMSALNAYCQFLEGLLPSAAGDVLTGQTLQSGVLSVEARLNDISRDLRRTEVIARLLRLRLYADAMGIAELDYAEAENEAATLAELQLQSMDPKADGGFASERREGRRGAEVGTAATAVALQALTMWEQAEEGAFRRPWQAVY